MIKKRVLFCSLILSMVLQSIMGQFNDCQIQIAPFSIAGIDEFSPVYYEKGLLFCSNQPQNSLIRYTSSGVPLFKIYYTEQKSSLKWANPVLQSWLSSSGSHEGPVSISKDGTRIYFSKNNETKRSLKSIKDTENKLGIYIAEKRNGIWEQTGPFIYNDPRYIFTTPSLDPDGLRIYFSSDKPGGYGGMDIYYCEWFEGKWCPPVNMGPLINTSGNESFPYADASGRVFFSSDKHQGRGGKDLFYTIQNNEIWINPVALDSAFNSPYDDFGIVIDSTGQNGYFSSNRYHSDDIFMFSSTAPEFKNCIPASEDNYCFTFYDEQHSLDSVPLLYIWDFGNGIIRKGESVGHCFPGPGNYLVKLKIYDLSTDSSLLSSVDYPVDLRNPDQPFIHSLNTALKGEAMDLYAGNTLKDNSQITGYYWNTGTEYNSGKSFCKTVFHDKGMHTVYLGISETDTKTGIIQNTCVSKQIWVVDDIQTMERKDPPNKDDILFKVILAGDFSRSSKESLENLFSGISFVVHQNHFESEPDSCRILLALKSLLKNNPDLELEIIVPEYSKGNLSDVGVVSEQWARTLAFYFKKHGIESDRIKSSAIAGSFIGNQNNPIQEEAAGVVEFIITDR